MPDEENYVEKVAQTSVWVLACKDITRQRIDWQHYAQSKGDRKTDLFKDPFMKLFYTAANKLEADKKILPPMQLTVAIRTKYYRKLISRYVKDYGISQVIILGSGLDTLPVRKKKYSDCFGVRFFEVDQKDVLDAKENVYMARNIEKNAVYIRCDYSQCDLVKTLIESGVDPALKTFFLWEGNILYLSRTSIEATIKNLSKGFEKMIISFDYLHSSALTDYAAIDAIAGENVLTNMHDQFSKSGATMRTGLNEMDVIYLAIQYQLQIAGHESVSSLMQYYDVDRNPHYVSFLHLITTVTNSKTLLPKQDDSAKISTALRSKL